MLKWLWLSAVVVVLDQISKQAIHRTFIPYEPLPIVPSLNITLMYNKGAAFSLLNDGHGWQRWFFTLLAIGVTMFIIHWMKKLTAAEKWTAVGLALIVGGAIGNLIDRLIYGQVIDFIQVFYQRWYWPTFNIADSAISVGVAILIIQTVLHKKVPA